VLLRICRNIFEKFAKGSREWKQFKMELREGVIKALKEEKEGIDGILRELMETMRDTVRAESKQEIIKSSSRFYVYK
jgi:hypothetical protein